LLQPALTLSNTYGETNNIRIGWFLAPAVKDHSGELINITVTVVKGSGDVKVEAGGDVSSSTRTSSKLAFYIACMAAGVDWRNFNSRIVFHTKDSVEGPSASFGIALVTYLLLKGFNVGLNHVITGAISPDFTSVPIGGVSYKLKAAESAGYKLFLPLANIGDVNKTGWRSAVFVTGIFNASSVLGFELNDVLNLSFISTGKIIPEVYETRTMKDALEMIHMAYNNLTTIPQSFKETHRDTYISALSLLNNTNQTIRSKDIYPYSAASLAFRALVNATAFHELYILEANVSSVKQELDSIKNAISNLSSLVNSIDAKTLWGFELKSIAASRLAEANITVQSLEGSKGSTDYSVYAWNLGYLKARLTSVSHWANLAIELNKFPPPISKENVHTALKAYIDYAKTTTNYQLSLINEAKINNEIKKVLLDELNRDFNLLDLAGNYWAKGEDSIAFGLAMEVMANSLSRFTGMIDSALSQSLYYMQGVESYTRELEITASLLELRALTSGYPSILTMDYIEYGKQLLKLGDLETAQGITSYGVSSSIFWILVSYSTQHIGEVNETATEHPQMSWESMTLYMTSMILLGISIGYIASLYSIRKRFGESLATP
jgi:predicted S18 family serine protease